MSNVITVNNNLDIPFGALSNNYKDTIKIEGIDWQSVTQYAYTKLLPKDYKVLYEKFLKITPTNIIQNKFEEYMKEITISSIRMSLEKILKEKFNNKHLVDLLLGTADYNIYYISYNGILGVDENHKGNNLFGIYLMQMRNKFKREMNVIQAENDIYNSFLVEKALKDLYMSGFDIKNFQSIDEIFKAYARQYGPNALTKTSKEAVIQMYNRNQIKKYDTIESLIKVIRRENIRSLRQKLLYERKNKIFDVYLDNMLRKNYPNLSLNDYKLAKTTFINENINEKNRLIDTVYNKYIERKLAMSLMDDINRVLESLPPIPSESDILNESENIQNAEEPISPRTQFLRNIMGIDVKTSNTNYQIANEIEIYDYKGEYTELSPVVFTGMVNIDNKLFPTILHYIYYNLLLLLRVKDAYQMLLTINNGLPENKDHFVSIQKLQDEYFNIYDHYYDNLEKYIKIGLDAKFSYNFFIQTLLLTNDANIVIKDDIYQNLVKNNCTGKYLVQLRTKLQSYYNANNVIISNDNIGEFLTIDPILIKWITLRANNDYNIISMVKQYVIDKNISSNFELSKENVRIIMNILYQSCAKLQIWSNKVTYPVPDYFKNIFKNRKLFLSEDIIQLLWRRIAVMIYVIKTYVSNPPSSYDIKKILINTQYMNSKPEICEEIISDTTSNCILLALINVLKNIIRFNKLLEFKTVIDTKFQKNKNNDNDIKTFINETTRLKHTEKILKELSYKDTEFEDKQVEDLKLRLSEKSNTIGESPEILLAASIILGKQISNNDLKVYLSQSYVNNNTRDEIEQDVLAEDIENKVEESSDTDTEFIFPTEDGEEHEDEDETFDSAPSDYVKLINILKTIDEVDQSDVEEVANYLMAAVELIKNYKMSKQVKTNRINFFAFSK
jgi:predicted NAD-dependent protein-ADP-ribosyltransferase YbiA (DUF1768 family)